ncbi:FUSC family protein [Gordonia sp. CPCC 205515]|uniref:FUSC family protein n=1 Tax=Gordonia sp. CPCC 205515 TaxID=3140791 RepID=UPI003AF3C2E0
MTTASLTSHVRGRSSALAHSVRPTTWRAALTIDMSRAAVAAPIRVGIAIAVVLIVGGLTGHRDIAGFAALGAVIAAFCRPDPYRVRAGRLFAIGVGIVAATAAGGVLGTLHAPASVQIIAVAVLAGLAALLVGMLRIVGPGAVIFVFAAAAAVGSVHDTDMLRRAVIATALGAIVGAIASLAPWLLGRARSEHTKYESVWRMLTRAPQKELVSNCVRIVVASAASAAAATALGLSHPMWAAMGAMTALQGIAYHVTVQRGVQRLLGNIAGAALAAILLGIGLGYWGAVIAIVIFQVVAEIMSTVNYALCSMAVTPMALLLTALSAGLTPAAAVDRIADTLIGVVIGIVVAALTITRGDLRALTSVRTA